MEYCYKKISELGRVVTGKTPPTEIEEYYGGSYPFITPSDIPSYDEKFLAGTERTISENGSRILKGTRLPANSICFVCIGSTIGKTCMTDVVSFSNQQINTLIPGKEYDSDYLFYYLRYIKSFFQLVGGGTGSGKGIVNKTLFSKTKISILEGKTNQQRIGTILSAYDNLIEVNNKRIKVLEQMAENLYKEWFVRFRFPGHETAEFENGIPKGWEEMKLEQFGISLDSGSRPSGGVDDTLPEGMPSLGAEAVNGLGEFDYNNVKLIPFDYYRKMSRGKNTGRDILIYKDGAYIGKTTIFMNGFPYENYAVNEHVFLLNALEADYQLYLYFTLHQAEYYALMQNLNRNAAQPGLSKQDINRIKIVVPIKERVIAFNAVVEPILNQVFSLAIQKQNLIKQRDLLLPRLMSGKLEV